MKTRGDNQILLAPDKQSIVYFALSCESPKYMSPGQCPWDVLYAFKISTSGDVQAVSNIETRCQRSRDFPELTYRALRAPSCDAQGLRSICFASMLWSEPNQESNNEENRGVIVFDERSYEFSQYEMPGILPTYGVAIWKDICIAAGFEHITFMDKNAAK